MHVDRREDSESPLRTDEEKEGGGEGGEGKSMGIQIQMDVS